MHGAELVTYGAELVTPGADLCALCHHEYFELSNGFAQVFLIFVRAQRGIRHPLDPLIGENQAVSSLLHPFEHLAERRLHSSAA